jgi:glutathione S-transferase
MSCSRSVVKVHTLDSALGKSYTQSLRFSSQVYVCPPRFTHLHPEKLPSAIERYAKEVKRVLGVLEVVLAAKPDSAQWLVGDHMTYADLSFVPWNEHLTVILMVPEEKKFAGFPHVQAWHESMIKRPSWKKAVKTRLRLMDEQGLDWNGIPKKIKNFQDYEAMQNSTD